VEERKEQRRRKRRNEESRLAMDRIVLSQKVELGKEVSFEGPPLEALRFQGVRMGSIVTLTDPGGGDFRGRVLSLSDQRASVFVFEGFPFSTESSLEIILLQALPEKERMELIIQKATELGVSVIVPFRSKRSISLEERDAKQKKSHRWQEIAIKAVQQCRRAKVPRVEPYRSFEEALEGCGEEGLRLFLWERGGEPLKEILKHDVLHRVYAMVGPEGGFTVEEVDLAKGKGFTPIKLGERILRTETAAITLIGILQYELGDLSG
jgi:16S rRNA (uracil1498-N3)-methyltransferase